MTVRNEEGSNNKDNSQVSTIKICWQYEDDDLVWEPELRGHIWTLSFSTRILCLPSPPLAHPLCKNGSLQRKPLSLVMAFRPSRTGPTFLPASFSTRYHVPRVLLFPSVSSMPFLNGLSHPCFLARGKR